MRSFLIQIAVSINAALERHPWLSRWSAWMTGLMNVTRIVLFDLRLLVLEWTGPEGTVTYIGEGYSTEVIAEMLFAQLPIQIRRARIALWQAPRLAADCAARGDLVVFELNELVHIDVRRRLASFSTPNLVRQIIEGIDRPVDDILAEVDQHTRSRILRLEAQGYHYEIARSDADFDLFYHRMYVPYVSGRFNGRGAFVLPYPVLHRSFLRGTLILVRRGEELVSGGIVHRVEDTCVSEMMGVWDGRYDLVKEGANVALWWYALLWGREKGARRYDLSTSLPYTADGVFTFKRQWGSRVVPSGEHLIWTFFWEHLTPEICARLNRQGVIVTHAGKLFKLWLGSNAPAEKEVLAKKMDSLTRIGLSGYALINPDGRTELLDPGSVPDPIPAGIEASGI